MQWLISKSAAWQKAKERQVPILMLLDVAWCPHSRAFREEELTHPDVLAVLAERFVCVHADADRHPELQARYGGPGWPTLALLDSQGECLAKSGPTARASLLALLRAWAVDPPGDPAPPTGAQALAGISDQVLALLSERADREFGGWGKRQKFPHSGALHFALMRWSRDGEQETLNLVTHTLQKMQAGAIHDRVEGGFFRYARSRDWGNPHYQKMLGSNAQRMLAYAEAYQALGTESFRATATGIHGWMRETLFDEETQAYRASQDEDETYFHLDTRAARARRSAPAVAPAIYTDRNCDAVCALLKAGTVFSNPEWIEQGLACLDFLVAKLYRPGKGAFHLWDGKPNQTGLLLDQAALLRAMTWATHYAGTRRYLGPARELARLTLHAHGDALPASRRPTDGSLVDRIHDVQPRGSIGERPEALLANARFAEALLSLGRMIEPHKYEQAAARILGAFQEDWPRFGDSIADYGRAVDLLLHEPVEVTIVGPQASPSTHAMRQGRPAPLPGQPSRANPGPRRGSRVPGPRRLGHPFRPSRAHRLPAPGPSEFRPHFPGRWATRAHHPPERAPELKR